MSKENNESFEKWCKNTIPEVKDSIKKVNEISEPYILCDLEIHRINKDGRCMVCNTELNDN